MEALSSSTSRRPSPSHLLPSGTEFPHLSSSHASTTLTLRRNHTSRRRHPRYHSRTLALRRSEHDVVVVGAGIIGLTIARQILLQSDLSVALLDARIPCSGATGAGQGYIWMGHRTPGDDVWELGLRSKQLWEDLAENLKCQGMDPLQELGWQKTEFISGSLCCVYLMTLEVRGLWVIQWKEGGRMQFFLSTVDRPLSLFLSTSAFVTPVLGCKEERRLQCWKRRVRRSREGGEVRWLEEERRRSSFAGGGGEEEEEIAGERSLLVGKTSRELAILGKRVGMFFDAGLRAEYLSSTALLSKVPEIDVGEDGGAAFFPNDCQLDAMKAVSFIEKGNRYFASEGRYAEFYNNPAVCVRYNAYGEVEAIQTPEHILYGRKAIVIAAGAWSGSLMQNLWKSKNVPNVPVKPRKGHLLVVENVGKVQLNHGMMELGYIDHLTTEALPLSGARATQHEQNASSISMTATIDTMGNLVLGSSRQFCGFSTEVDKSIIKKIWERAGEFLPSLRKLSLDSFQENIRVGLRPWMPDGRPVIGPVPGLPNVVAATGHEGGGLCMALGTAEMVVDLVIGNPTKIPHDLFSFHGRDA